MTSETTVAARENKLTLFRVLRLVFVIIVFITGCLSIVFSQFVVLQVFRFQSEKKQKWINYTKRNFVVLLTFVMNLCSPTRINITHDGSIPAESFFYAKSRSGNEILKARLDPNAIIISNHQIYTDWLFMWWCAYISDVADHFYIIMKKSLENIPILGYGMANYDFIFLSRKWEVDRDQMTRQLQLLTHDDHWLLIFPEGTNMSKSRKEISDRYTEKIGAERLSHVLLPRIKGLYASTKVLKETTDTIYDITVAYSGHTPDEFAQDIYTLGAIFLFGKGPQSVDMHFKAHKISSVLQGVKFDESDDDFDEYQNWLFKTWADKDALMEEYFQTGSFVDKYQEVFKTRLMLNSRLEIFHVYSITSVTIFTLWALWKLWWAIF